MLSGLVQRKSHNAVEPLVEVVENIDNQQSALTEKKENN